VVETSSRPLPLGGGSPRALIRHVNIGEGPYRATTESLLGDTSWIATFGIVFAPPEPATASKPAAAASSPAEAERGSRRLTPPV
jgi:hypothetical protein